MIVPPSIDFAAVRRKLRGRSRAVKQVGESASEADTADVAMLDLWVSRPDAIRDTFPG